MSVRIVACFAVLAFGCSGTLEQQHAVGVSQRKVGATHERDRESCAALSHQHRAWGGTAAFSSFLAGGSGLATIPVDDPTWRTSLAIGAAVTGGIAVASKFISDDAATTWARDCSQ